MHQLNENQSFNKSNCRTKIKLSINFFFVLINCKKSKTIIESKHKSIVIAKRSNSTANKSS